MSATLPAMAWHTGQWRSASAISFCTSASGAGELIRVWRLAAERWWPLPSPHSRRDVTRVSTVPSGMSRARAMPVRVEVKQLASAAAKSSSGFDSPPGPPSSAWVAVATESEPESPSTRPW